MTFPVKDFLSKKKFSVSREIALTYIEVLLRLCSDFNKNVKKTQEKTVNFNSHNAALMMDGYWLCAVAAYIFEIFLKLPAYWDPTLISSENLCIDYPLIRIKARFTRGILTMMFWPRYYDFDCSCTKIKS